MTTKKAATATKKKKAPTTKAAAPAQAKKQKRAQKALTPGTSMTIKFVPEGAGATVRFIEHTTKRGTAGKTVGTTVKYEQSFAARSSAIEALNTQLVDYIERTMATVKDAMVLFDAKADSVKEEVKP